MPGTLDPKQPPIRRKERLEGVQDKSLVIPADIRSRQSHGNLVRIQSLENQRAQGIRFSQVVVLVGSQDNAVTIMPSASPGPDAWCTADTGRPATGALVAILVNGDENVRDATPWRNEANCGKVAEQFLEERR